MCGQEHLYVLDWGWWFGLRPGWVIVLFSWARHLTFAVPLSTYKVGLGMGTNKLSGKPDELQGGGLSMDWYLI